MTELWVRYQLELLSPQTPRSDDAEADGSSAQREAGE